MKPLKKMTATTNTGVVAVAATIAVAGRCTRTASTWVRCSGRDPASSSPADRVASPASGPVDPAAWDRAVLVHRVSPARRRQPQVASPGNLFLDSFQNGRILRGVNSKSLQPNVFAQDGRAIVPGRDAVRTSIQA